MDRNKDFGWIRQHMPRIVGQLAEYREAGEGAHIDECWRRGVLKGEPGFFFAKEGPVTLGTPFDREIGSLHSAMELAAWQAHGAVLQLAPLPSKGVTRGSN